MAKIKEDELPYLQNTTMADKKGEKRVNLQ